MMKIVVLDGYAADPGDISWDEMRKIGELTVYDRTLPEEAASRIGGADAALTNKVLITDEIMAKCPNLKYIGVLATGYNVVNIQAAAARGITVTNIPAYSTDSVGQLTMALLLEICHHVGHHSVEIQNGRWGKSPDFTFWDYPLIELSGKTLGVIGFGHIGQRVAKLAEAFGMEILAFARHPRKELETEHCHYAPLEKLFAESDVITLHCPLSNENKELINKETISMMKPGVIILNTARGGLINEQDMADALADGRVYAFGADVVSSEPMPDSNPLRGAKNCFLTPHIAWAPYEARVRLMDIAVGNLKAFSEGKTRNKVN